jgi:hypothetical protein
MLAEMSDSEKQRDLDVQTASASEMIAELPTPVAAYIRATNLCDLDALLETFVDDALVTAHVDGLFDKRGLPDPLVLAFYFSFSGNKIVQLIILRNQTGI